MMKYMHIFKDVTATPPIESKPNKRMMVLFPLRKPSRQIGIVVFYTIILVIKIGLQLHRQVLLFPFSHYDMLLVFPSVTGYQLPIRISSSSLHHYQPQALHNQNQERRIQQLNCDCIVNFSYCANQDIARFTSSRRSFVIDSTGKSTSTSLSLSSRDDDNILHNIKTNPSSSNTKRSGAEFEYQEMKVILDALQREGIVSSNRMNRNKANEMNSYIQRIVSDRTSTTSSMTMDNDDSTYQEQQLQSLCNTSWTLKYTTMDILPPDTTIQFQFLDAVDVPTDLANPTNSMTTVDDSNDSMPSTTPRKMKYRLLFGSKTFGLNALNVDCDWRLVPYSYNDIHDHTTLSLTFDTITMDAFGWNNIPLCFLSNLFFQNRNNNNNNNNPDVVINTVYLDDHIWIEQQMPSSSSSSSLSDADDNVIWNVYRKDEVDRI